MNDDRILSEEVRPALFRIYLAAIYNIFRHAAASGAWVIFKLTKYFLFRSVR